jgi:hypothetical protein
MINHKGLTKMNFKVEITNDNQQHVIDLSIERLESIIDDSEWLMLTNNQKFQILSEEIIASLSCVEVLK